MQERTSGSRIAVGLLLAPILPSVLFAAMLSGGDGKWNELPLIAAVTIAVCEILSLVVALPLYLALRRVRAIGPLECAAIGIITTVALNLVLMFLTADPEFSAHDLLSITVESVLGVAIALSFWFIAIRRTKS